MSYLTKMIRGMFGGIKVRFSNIRTLYQLSSKVVVASCSAADMLHKADGLMKKEDYLQQLDGKHN